MDHQTSLVRIAKAIETLPETAWYEPWISPLAILVSGLLSGMLAFTAAMFTIRRQRDREESVVVAQKRLVEHTLHEEISKRWKLHLGARLIESFDKGFSIDRAAYLASFRLSIKDLFIIDHVSNDFSQYQFLSPELVSQIVHAHVLLRDVIDNQDFLKELTRDRESMIDRKSAEIAYSESIDEESAYTRAVDSVDSSVLTRIESRWGKLKDKCMELDARLDEIMEHITQE